MNKHDLARQTTDRIFNLIGELTEQVRITDNKWKEHYDTIKSELASELTNSDELIKDHKENNLTFNTIEQEGYRRCLITMINRFEQIESWME